ncbi:MAG: ABC transporter ATP-binding protein [Acidobacteriota bacterium]|nr:ABC transporter ATP-binding protein [Acidobacteriota bacterium]
MSAARTGPVRRLMGYVGGAKLPYVFGAVLTVGYAVLFQLIPLSIRRIVAALESEPGLVTVAVRDLVLLSAVFALFRLGSRIVMFRIGRQIEFRLRNDYFSHLQRLPQSFFNSHRTGDLMSRAVNDINGVRLFLGMGLLNIVQTPVLFVGAIVVMLGIDPALTLWVVAPYPAFILITRFFGRRMFAANMEGQEQLGRVSTLVQENASGVLVVRSNSLEDRERRRFEDENLTLYARMMKVAKINITMQSVVGLLPAVTAGLVILVGGRAVVAGTLASEDLWVFWIYIGMLTFPTIMLGFVISIAQRGFAGLVRIGEVLDTDPSIKDRPDVEPMTEIRGQIALRGLRFSYPKEGSEPVLAEVDLDIESGKTVGIVGPVGAGKSTLVSVVPRLLEVSDGQVFIDGIDVNRVPVGLLRSSIAMVPQDSFLFSTTLADNIRFGRPDATMDEVRDAARRAHVLSDIEDFPEGFDTQVGERGITLSGGQRQRVAIARALVLDPSILILDDALSSVDHATEEAILGDLDSARTGRTCFIVAHRISAVRGSDQILVLERGRVSERGTHRQLVEMGGFYARLNERQKLEEEIEEMEPVVAAAAAGANMADSEGVG